MFNHDISRIGFACKLVDPNKDQLTNKQIKESTQPYNTRATTVQWLNRQKIDVAEQRLWDLLYHNINSFYNLVRYVSELPQNLRMVRLSSDCLPLYTEPTWQYFWQQPDVQRECERLFAKVGNLARERDVRLSTHPGQFTVLASDNPDVVKRSIQEFEYHTDMVRWMGFGQQFQDFKTNVHISGRQGPDGIKEVLPRLSPEARNTITIENDENKWGLEHSLELANHCALVLDIHHHFCRDQEYIWPNDDRFKRVIDSWRDVRPVIHYSVSQEHILEQIPNNQLPSYKYLESLGYKKTKLRSHSDGFPNSALNDWALCFLQHADIMNESKLKNLSAQQLYDHWFNKY